MVTLTRVFGTNGTKCSRFFDNPTWVYVLPFSKRGMFHCPRIFLTHATALPSLRRSTVRPPAETINTRSLKHNSWAERSKFHPWWPKNRANKPTKLMNKDG